MSVIIGLDLHKVRHESLKLIFKPVSDQKVKEDDSQKLELDPIKKLLAFLTAIS